MAFTSQMIDQLRDLLNDAADTQVSLATKILYLNLGIARLWPRIWRLVSDSTIVVVDDQYDYSWSTPWVGPSDYHVLSVEVTDNDTGTRNRWDDYDIIQGDEDLAMVFRFSSLLPPVGSTVHLRLAAAIPFISAASYAAAQTETWYGPDRALGLPVLYAMGMIAQRRLDDRQDYTRYSTTQAVNGVTDTDIMDSARFWFGQFELELDQMERVLPIAKD